MQRNKLIAEVKQEYARLAAMQSVDHMINRGTEPSDAFFERLLGHVIAGIEEGRFDRFMNGRQIMEAVAHAPARWGIPEQ